MQEIFMLLLLVNKVVLSQQIQIYTCLYECRPMKFCLIYRLARVGTRSIGRLIYITGNSIITGSLVCNQRLKSLQYVLHLSDAMRVGEGRGEGGEGWVREN